MDYKKELENIEREQQKRKEARIRLEERAKQLDKELEDIKKKLKEENIAEDQLEGTIAKLEMELQEGITKCNEILNQK